MAPTPPRTVPPAAVLPEPDLPESVAVSPVLVATLRAMVYAVVIGAATALVAVVNGLQADQLGDYAWALPFLIAGGRVIEGVVDRLRGQAPQLPGGSKPADPAAYVAGPWLPMATEVREMEPPVAVAITLPSTTPTREQVYAAVTAAMPRSSLSTRDRVTDEVLSTLGGQREG